MARYWQYRVIETYCGNGEFTWCVHEVYYNEDGKPTSWSAEPVSLYTEEPAGIHWMAEKVLEAVKKPVLKQVYDVETSKWKLEGV